MQCREYYGFVSSSWILAGAAQTFLLNSRVCIYCLTSIPGLLMIWHLWPPLPELLMSKHEGLILLLCLAHRALGERPLLCCWGTASHLDLHFSSELQCQDVDLLWSLIRWWLEYIFLCIRGAEEHGDARSLPGLPFSSPSFRSSSSSTFVLGSLRAGC